MSGAHGLPLKSMSCTISSLSMLVRLAYWLGKRVDASWKSEKMAPSKLTLCKYFPYSCFLYTCFCAVLKHFREVNSRVGIFVKCKRCTL